VKIDTQGRKKPAAQPMGTLRLTQWLSLGETELLRGSWDIKGRDQEYKGIKQGEEPKGGSIDAAHVIELKKDYLKLDLQEQAQPIADAVKKGVAALRKMQEQKRVVRRPRRVLRAGFPGGGHLARPDGAAHSGVKADDPALRSGFRVHPQPALQEDLRCRRR
jgi:hypothetical protein